MTNFPGDAVYELETQMLLNRFRCAAQLIGLREGEETNRGANVHADGERIEQPDLIIGLVQGPNIPNDADDVSDKQGYRHRSYLAEQQQERAGEHRAGGEERHKAALEEIERRVAETIARHKLFAGRSR